MYANKNFPESLYATALQRKREIQVTSNYELNLFFWQMGAAINNYMDTLNEKEKSIHLKESLSVWSMVKFGSFFSGENLTVMCRFHRTFSDFNIATKFASFLDWEHITTLVCLEQQSDILHAIRLILQDGLSNAQLKKVTENMPSSFPKADNNETVFTKVDPVKLSGLIPEPMWAIWEKVQTEDLYTGAHSIRFRELMHFPDREEPALAAQTETKTEDIIAVIRPLILQFRRKHSTWLNSHLNITYWMMGKQLNEALSNYKSTADKQGAIKRATFLFRQKNGEILFDAEDLKGMALFNERCNDNALSARLAYLVNWEQLLALLSLPDIETMIFYGRLLAQNELQLHELLTTKESDGLPTVPEHLRTELSTGIIGTKTSVEKEGNSEITITEKFVKLDSDIINKRSFVDIFSNRYFLALAVDLS